MKSLENKALAVGRVGNDPTTNGLKGPESETTLTRKKGARVRKASAREPRVNQDELEASVLQRVQEVLWSCGGVHVMRNNAGSRRRKQPLEPGSSDLFAIVAPYGRWLCIETKRPKNAKVAMAQLKWLDKMRRYGAVCAVVRNPDEVFDLVAMARKATT